MDRNFQVTHRHLTNSCFSAKYRVCRKYIIKQVMQEKDTVKRRNIGILSTSAFRSTERNPGDVTRQQHSEGRRVLLVSSGPPQGLYEKSPGCGAGLTVSPLSATQSLEQISQLHPISSRHSGQKWNPGFPDSWRLT
jgi:hypothetical protein